MHETVIMYKVREVLSVLSSSSSSSVLSLWRQKECDVVHIGLTLNAKSTGMPGRGMLFWGSHWHISRGNCAADAPGRSSKEPPLATEQSAHCTTASSRVV